MSTLYLRNVPGDVVDRLERLAKLESLSVSALAIRELAEASRRVDNPSLLGDLPDLGSATGNIVRDLEADREQR